MRPSAGTPGTSTTELCNPELCDARGLVVRDTPQWAPDREPGQPPCGLVLATLRTACGMRTALHARAARQGDPCAREAYLAGYRCGPGPPAPGPQRVCGRPRTRSGLHGWTALIDWSPSTCARSKTRRPTFPGPEARRDQLIAALAQHSPDHQELRADSPTLELGERRGILRAGIDEVLVRRASGQFRPAESRTGSSRCSAASPQTR